MALLAAPIAVLAAGELYYGTINVSNNGTAESDVATIMSVNSTSLIDVYNIDTAFDYVAIRNSTGAYVPFMPGYTPGDYPWCLWVPDIGDYANLNYILYTGNASLGATKYYFPGSTGMTVPNTLTEPGTNFSIRINDAWINPTGYTTNTTTFYPDPHAEISSVDGYAIHLQDNTAWTTLRGAAGTNGYESENITQVMGFKTGSTSLYTQIYRSLYVFDTSTLPSDATVLSANFYLYGYAKVDNNAAAPNINIYSSAPATNTAIVAGDYDSLGSTAFSTPIVYGDWSITGYNVFPLNADGIAAIEVDDVSKFGTRSANYDVANVAPPRAGNNLYTSVSAWSADLAGIDKDPKLTVTYTSRLILDKSNALIVYLNSGNITAEIYGETGITTPIAEGEHDIEVSLSGANFTMQIDTGVPVYTNFAGSVPVSGTPWLFCPGTITPYVGSVEYDAGGVAENVWEWEYGTTFTDSLNGIIATPTFREASSDEDVSAALASFAPITVSRPPAYSVSDAPAFITGNITMAGQFTTGGVSYTGGPAGFRLVNDVAAAGGTPNIWIWGIIAMCMTTGGGLFYLWMQKKYGFRSLWPVFGIGVFVLGIFTALGGTVKVFDFWMVAMYCFIFLAIMVASRHGDIGGSVSQHGLIGFLAQSWIGLTIINKLLEGSFMGASETSWVNNFAFTQNFRVFNIFSVPVLNLDFFTKGIPSLLRWDYSFFGGNAQMFQYLMYSITAVVTFIIFTIIIGMLYNFFRGR